jgi:hypothetical protein
VVEGREMVMRDGLALDGFEEPLRFVHGVNLVELAEVAPESTDLTSLIPKYFARVTPIDPRSLLLALAFLVSRDALLDEDVGR